MCKKNNIVRAYIFSSKASFMWKSMMECTWIIEEGTIWQIGNEQTAKIWQHKWVSNVRDNCIHGDILKEVDPNALQKSLQST